MSKVLIQLSFILFLMVCALAIPGDSLAATVTNTNDSGPGSLRDAIAATPAGGTVNFALSGCPCTIVLTTGDLAITKDLTVIGPGADQLTISGNNAWRPFRIGAMYVIPTPPPIITVVLDGLRLTNGRAGVWPPFSNLDKYGGGIISVNSNLTIRNSIISNNFAERNGGGIASVISNTTIINSTISGNVAVTGGGISHEDNCALSVINSIISDNQATGGFFGGVGGGIYSNFFTGNQIINSTIARNEAGFASAAYIFQWSTVEIANSTIEGNTSRVFSGTLVIQITTASITNSTISGNTSLNGSAGIIHENFFLDYPDMPIHSQMMIANTTITDNRGTGDGGGIITYQEPGYPATTTLRNSIVAGNATNLNAPPADVLSDNGGVFASSGYNLIGNAGTITAFNQPGDQAGTPGAPLNPRLESLAFNGGPTKTHALRFDSPALDRGKAFGLITDQRGFGRPFDNPDLPNAPGGDGSDIGAFERQNNDSTPIAAPFDFDGDGRSDISVFRPSDRTWYLNRSTAGFAAAGFGLSTDEITPADFDGDGKSDQAIYRGSGEWHLNRSAQGYAVVQFGLSTDKPMVGDYDGDGRADQAVYRDGTWYLLQSSQGLTAFQFGIATDIPAPADYDGDGRTDATVYRDGTWWILQSASGQVRVNEFGLTNDKPVPAAFLP